MKEIIERTPTTIINAFNNGKEILTEEVTDCGRPVGIINIILGEVGVHVQHYRGDILYDMARLFRAIGRVSEEESPVFLTLGLRKFGVDGNEFFISRVRDSNRNGIADMADTYEKIYMLKVWKEWDSLFVKVELREINLVVEYVAEDFDY